MSVTPDIARTASKTADSTDHASAQPFGLIAAIAIAGLSVLLPVTRTAALLVGAESARLEVVADGVRVFKALLLFHAILCALLSVIRIRPTVVPLMAAQPAERASRYTALALAGLIVAGTLVRIAHLGDALWYDEIAALVDQIRQPIGRLLSGFSSQNQHPLYSLFANGSLALFGDSIWALRLPAVLLGIASLGALYMFGTRVTDRREALLATALMAVSYHHVWFSQNARGYSGLLLFALLGTALLVDLLRRHRWRGWGLYVAYAAVMALGMYTHLTAAFVLVAHALVVAVLMIRARVRSRPLNWPVLVALVLAGTLALQLYALVAPQMPATLFGARVGVLPAAEWKSPLWLLQESLRGLNRGVPGGWVGIGIAALVGGAGLVSYARRDAAVLGLMVLPAAILGAVMVATHHNLWPRFFFFAGGFAVLIGVRGVFSLATTLSRKRGPVLATAALAFVILGSAALVGRAWGPKQDFSGARTFVDAQRQPGDAVVIAGLTRLPYERYLETGWLPVNNARELQSIEASHPRTWVVYTLPEHLRVFAPEVLQRVEQSYRVARAFPGTLGGGTVYVMVNR